MIRIIAGESKNAELKPIPGGYDIRPILARIRKSLFDMLAPVISGSRFLDLFAGSGIVGIEALSRGARHATFVEGQKKVCRMIEANLARLKYEERASVICRDVTLGLKGIGGQYDIIFAGPPYLAGKGGASAIISATLKNINEADVLKGGSVIIVQHHSKDSMPEGPVFECFKQKKYGDSRLSFFRRAAESGA